MDNHVPGGRALLDWVASVVLVMETVMVMAIAGVYLAYVFVDDPGNTAQWTSLAVLAFILGAGLSAATAGWWRLRRWARSAVMTWQVLQFAVAGAVVSTHPWIAAALMTMSVVVALAVVAQARRRGEDDFADDPPSAR